MRHFTLVIALFALLAVSACSSSGGITSAPTTTPLPPCKDGICVQQAIASLTGDGHLSILFTLTDQDGQANAARPPQLTQSTLSLQVYQLASDQSEKLLSEQVLNSEDLICWVTNTATWSKGKLSAVCGLPVSVRSNVQIGDQLKVRLNEFNFEQAVEVSDAANNSAANRPASVDDWLGGTRIVLAPPDCSNWTASGKLAEQLYQAGQIILYRLHAVLQGRWNDITKPAVFIDECTITVELSPLGDPTPYIQLMQPPGRFELIDAGSERPAPGTVVRTTGTPSPTVPISAALQAAIPPKKYEVIATNTDLDLNQLMVADSENGNSQRLLIGFQEAAAQKIAKVTSAHAVSMNSNDPYYLCILLDNIVQTCPAIHGPLINGSAVVSFNDSFEAERLASILRHGVLPLELQIFKMETIYSQTTN